MQVQIARDRLQEQVDVVTIPQDDAWFRDTAPTVIFWLLVVGDTLRRWCLENTVLKAAPDPRREHLTGLFEVQFLTKKTRLAGVDWKFNGYGGDVYDSWERDEKALFLCCTCVGRCRLQAYFDGALESAEASSLLTVDCGMHFAESSSNSISCRHCSGGRLHTC